MYMEGHAFIVPLGEVPWGQTRSAWEEEAKTGSRRVWKWKIGLFAARVGAAKQFEER